MQWRKKNRSIWDGKQAGRPWIITSREDSGTPPASFGGFQGGGGSIQEVEWAILPMKEMLFESV